MNQPRFESDNYRIWEWGDRPYLTAITVNKATQLLNEFDQKVRYLEQQLGEAYPPTMVGLSEKDGVRVSMGFIKRNSHYAYKSGFYQGVIEGLLMLGDLPEDVRERLKNALRSQGDPVPGED